MLELQKLFVLRTTMTWLNIKGKKLLNAEKIEWLLSIL